MRRLRGVPGPPWTGPQDPPRSRLRAVAAALTAFALLVAAAPAAAADVLPLAGSWQGAQLDLPLAWQVTRGSPGVVVAVVDTGVDAGHFALQGHVLPGYDLVGNHAGGGDDNGHGTAAAGIVAATCPDCRILPVKVLDANGNGNWDTIAAGIRWAADHGAQVVNLSVGAPRALDELGAAVAYALAKGVIVVAAAGNNGSNAAFYPAAYPGVVSVAGIDENSARYSWSDFGSWVSVAAPGCATTTWLGGAYESNFCGTSTAAPFVAGVAGLARAYRPDLTPAAFADAVRSSTAPLPDPGVDGSGRVDANALLLALGAPSAAPVVDAQPTVPGVPRVGRALSAVPGTWAGAATTSVGWQRSRDGATWEDVGSGAVYRPRAADLGFRLRVVVAAVNVRGSATATSAASAAVRAPAPQKKAKPAARKRHSRTRG